MKTYKLKDLVSVGSNARKKVDSDVIIGDVSNGYGYGDILDANATSQLITLNIEHSVTGNGKNIFVQGTTLVII